MQEIFSQQSTMINNQVGYRNVEHRTYLENVKLSSYGHRMAPALPDTNPNHQQTETTETRIIKHPDEKIVHHPSSIYVKRPPTYVTINHPDIIIEPVNKHQGGCKTIPLTQIIFRIQLCTINQQQWCALLLFTKICHEKFSTVML